MRKEKVRRARTPKVLKSCSGKRLEGVIQTQRKSTIPSHLKIMILITPDESWSSETKIFGYDQRICLGIFLFLWPFVSCLSGIIVEDHSRSGRPERTRSKKPRSRRHRKVKTRSGTLVDASRHPGPELLHLHLLPDENGAHARRVSVPIGNHQPTGVAHAKPRVYTDWQ